jgi:hypothetical protein
MLMQPEGQGEQLDPKEGMLHYYDAFLLMQ